MDLPMHEHNFSENGMFLAIEHRNRRRWYGGKNKGKAKEMPNFNHHFTSMLIFTRNDTLVKSNRCKEQFTKRDLSRLKGGGGGTKFIFW